MNITFWVVLGIIGIVLLGIFFLWLILFTRKPREDRVENEVRGEEKHSLSSSPISQPEKKSRGQHETGLPKIRDLEQLASYLEISYGKLRWMMDQAKGNYRNGISCHYVARKIPKASGGERLLLVPKQDLMDIQYWILEEILEKISPHDAAHGFRSGRSILTNAQQHVCKEALVKFDLKDFFPLIRCPRVRGIFSRLGFSEKVAGALACLTTTRIPLMTRRGLPQGAPTSPILSNLVTRKLDVRCSRLAGKLNFSYSRYADDMTFSGSSKNLSTILRLVPQIIREEKFRINRKKVRIQRSGARQMVTGVVVNKCPGVSREERLRLRAIIHNASKRGLESQNRIGHANFLAYMHGKVGFVKMVNPDQGRKLENQLNKIVNY